MSSKCLATRQGQLSPSSHKAALQAEVAAVNTQTGNVGDHGVPEVLSCAADAHAHEDGTNGAGRDRFVKQPEACVRFSKESVEAQPEGTNKNQEEDSGAASMAVSVLTPPHSELSTSTPVTTPACDERWQDETSSWHEKEALQSRAHTAKETLAARVDKGLQLNESCQVSTRLNLKKYKWLPQQYTYCLFHLRLTALWELPPKDQVLELPTPWERRAPSPGHVPSAAGNPASPSSPQGKVRASRISQGQTKSDGSDSDEPRDSVPAAARADDAQQAQKVLADTQTGVGAKELKAGNENGGQASSTRAARELSSRACPVSMAAAAAPKTKLELIMPTVALALLRAAPEPMTAGTKQHGGSGSGTGTADGLERRGRIPNDAATVVDEPKSTRSLCSVGAMQAAEEAGLHTTLAQQRELECAWSSVHACDEWPIGAWSEGFGPSNKDPSLLDRSSAHALRGQGKQTAGAEGVDVDQYDQAVGNADADADTQDASSAGASVEREGDDIACDRNEVFASEVRWTPKPEPTLAERLRVPGRTPRLAPKESFVNAKREFCVLVLFTLSDADKGEALAKTLRVVVARHVPPDGTSCVVRTACGAESDYQLQMLEDCLMALPLISRAMQVDPVMLRQAEILESNLHTWSA